MDRLEESILRLHHEPCVYYPEALVHQALMDDISAFMNELDLFYSQWSKNPGIVQQPPKQLFGGSGVSGDWRVMPCAVDGFPCASQGLGGPIKVVKVIGTNEEQRVVPDKISVGKALLINPVDHHVEAIFDVAALSSYRTAAISVLAAKYCGYAQSQSVGIVGAGRIGYYTAAICSEWLGAENFFISDIDQDRALTLAEIIASGFGRTARCVPLLESSRLSQALFLATTSKVPVLESSDAPFISSVGADADNLAELASGLISGRKIVSESAQNIAFGDLRRWHLEGLIQIQDIHLLTDVIGSASRGELPPAAVLFVSTGTAVQDALVCRFVHNRLRGSGALAL